MPRVTCHMSQVTCHMLEAKRGWAFFSQDQHLANICFLEMVSWTCPLLYFKIRFLFLQILVFFSRLNTLIQINNFLYLWPDQL